MRHCSSSDTLKQIEQNRTRCLTSSSTSASRRTSLGSACNRWNAIRCAPLGPTPGRRPSSSMRSWTMPSYNSGVLGEAESAGAGVGAGAAEAGHAAPGQRTERAAGHRVGLRLRVAVRRDHEVAEVAQVIVARAVERTGLDGDRLQLTDAVHGDPDRTTARAALDACVREPLLSALELLLHLLGLLEEPLEVEAAGAAESLEGIVVRHGFTCRAGLGGATVVSLVWDLFDDLRAQCVGEQLRAVEAGGLRIGVVVASAAVGVGRLGARSSGVAGAGDRVARGGGRSARGRAGRLGRR